MDNLIEFLDAVRDVTNQVYTVGSTPHNRD